MPKTARKRTLLDQSKASKKTKTTALDLRRLLNTMEKDPDPTGHSSLAIKQRAELLMQLFEDSPDSSLKARVQAAVSEADRVASQRKEPQEDDLVQKIFKKTGTASPPEEMADEEEANDVSKPPSPRSRRLSKKNATHSVKELQKQQRAQMEEAVSQMASQMKNQTAEIHSKLSKQTGTLLDEMTDIATQNASELKEVAESTQEHVKKSWKRTAFTWTVLLTVFGAFVATMLTIQMIPKRTSCVLPFFCGDSGKFCRTTNGKRECMDRPPVESEMQDKVKEEKIVHEPVAEDPVHKPVTEDPVPEAHVENERVDAHVEDQRVEARVEDELVEEGETVYEEVEKEEEIHQREEEHVEPEPGYQWEYTDAARAAAFGELDVLREIASNHRDLFFHQDQNGWGVLHEAVRSGNVELVEFLLNSGVDVNLRTIDGSRALDLAIESLGLDHPMIDALKLAMGMECEVGTDGACIVNVPSDEDMRQEALREYQETTDGQQKLSPTQASEQLEEPQEATGIPTDKQREYVYEGKPFSSKDIRRAASRGDVRRMRGYMEFKPPFLDEKDENGWTALHLAVRQGNLEIVELLLEGGADQGILNNNDKNSIDLAVARWGDNSPMTNLLEEYE